MKNKENLTNVKKRFRLFAVIFVSLTLAAANADELSPLLSHDGTVTDTPENDKLELATLKPSKSNIASLLDGYTRANDGNGHSTHFSFKLNTFKRKL